MTTLDAAQPGPLPLARPAPLQLRRIAATRGWIGLDWAELLHFRELLYFLVWRDVKVLGSGEELNQSLEKAGRVADFFELAELMCLDALERNESCGGHFREEFQTPEGEAQRDDDHYAYSACWEFRGAGNPPVLHKEPLAFEYVHPSQRSYK